MPIPEFNRDGFLPVGVYDCEWDEIQHRFGRTENGASRAFLFGKLMEYRQELAATGLAMGLIVDGSFVTQTADPHDIDLVLILSKDHDFTAEMRPFSTMPCRGGGCRSGLRSTSWWLVTIPWNSKSTLSFSSKCAGRPVAAKEY